MLAAAKRLAMFHGSLVGLFDVLGHCIEFFRDAVDAGSLLANCLRDYCLKYGLF